jgi:hypothetical protein
MCTGTLHPVRTRDQTRSLALRFSTARCCGNELCILFTLGLQRHLAEWIKMVKPWRYMDESRLLSGRGHGNRNTSEYEYKRQLRRPIVWWKYTSLSAEQADWLWTWVMFFRYQTEANWLTLGTHYLDLSNEKCSFLYLVAERFITISIVSPSEHHPGSKHRLNRGTILEWSTD